MGVSLPVHASDFSRLFREHAAFVTHRARCAGVPHADLPDVVQIVFLALHEAIVRGLDTSKPLHGWLREVTFRAARDHLKLARHAHEVLAKTGSVEAADETPNPEDRMLAIDVHRLVESVLDMLPAEQRIVLVMSDMEEMPMPKIAGVLEIPVGTGYTRLRAGRASFETVWNRQRATSHAAILPFALWEGRDLLHAAKPVPELSAEVMDKMWSGLVGALGSSILAGAAAGAAAVTAAKAGVALTVNQAVAGAVAAMLVGAGLHALLGGGPAPSSAQTAASSSAAALPAPVAVLPEPSDVAAPSSSVAVAPSASAKHAALDNEVLERRALETARDAINRGEIQAAREALSHVKSARFVEERDEMRRSLPQQDGGS